MQINEVLDKIKPKMDGAINVLDNELKGLRTGRASVHFLDPVHVDAYGSKMPLSQVATVSTPDAKTISVQVWDNSMVKAVEKAIVDANLGLNPSSDGQYIRINLPPISEERRKELVKFAYKYAENSKISIRNVRRDGMDMLKKAEKDNEISKDEHHDYGEEVQKLTDQYIDNIDNMAKKKEQEILTV